MKNILFRLLQFISLCMTISGFVLLCITENGFWFILSPIGAVLLLGCADARIFN